MMTMKKNYIKMNENDDYLSLGNFIRLVKELAKNKTSALQTEIFCALFDVDIVSSTTVNNYCVGIRSIGDAYKQHYLFLQNRYKKNKDVFVPIFHDLLQIMEGHVIEIHEKEEFNKEICIQELAKKLYVIAKNDEAIRKDLLEEWLKILRENDFYYFLAEVLFYVVLKNKQPLYEVDCTKNKMEDLLENSYLSYKGVDAYLKLKLQENVNYDFTLKKLAKEGNVLANYELGTKEYLGYVKGIPRYIEAYQYLRVASDAFHAGATYLIGHMLFMGMLGERMEKDLKEAYSYFEKARSLGSAAASNKIGVMYVEGIYPLTKDSNKAKELFLEATEKNYAYAFNNLGKMYEKENKEEFITFYQKSASLKESWACNKMGEYYRKNGDQKKAFLFYQEAIEANIQNLCYYAYYNLGRYFYLFGSKEAGISQDIKKAIEYLKIASEHGILKASIDLFCFFIDRFVRERKVEDEESIFFYKKRIERHEEYGEEVRKLLEEKLGFLKQKESIKESLLLDLLE